MKHVTMADKSLLMGDEAADTLVKYAAMVAQIGGGDAVTLRALGMDGEDVSVSFLLNSGTVMLSESTFSNLPEPDNSEPVAYMRSRIGAFESPGNQSAAVDSSFPSEE
jgi:hypothetical protein